MSIKHSISDKKKLRKAGNVTGILNSTMCLFIRQAMLQMGFAQTIVHQKFEYGYFNTNE